VITFEENPEQVSLARGRVRQAGLSDVVTVVQGSTHDTLASTLKAHAAPESCRLALLDASHLYADIAFEFETLLPYMTSDGIIIFDNTYNIATSGEDGRVNAFLRTVARTYPGALINLPYASWFTPGIAIWQLSPDLDVQHGIASQI